ncbi:MAG TPA: TonB-dependent receptor, partial [Candidatus Polarisedimenticolaceae bacterium]|nr:TonB-dependent receptor [Candidatus Polarisedimenticolaceae bacterium]
MRRIALAMALLLPALVLAQAETTGRISGVVKDPEGKPIANAEITVSSPALQGDRVLKSDASGRYLATQLPPGQYLVSIEATGMNTGLYNLPVGIGQDVPLEVTLTPGERVNEQVTVYAPAARLETTATGENFNYKEQVDELPIVNRNIERVAELAPNISFGPTPDTLSIAGAPSFDTSVLLDGAEISDPYFGSAPDVYVEEAVEEVQVLTGGISARYGRFQGGVINATTKSGGNTFDGSVRADLDKETWNSTTPFGEQQSDELNRVYSGTISGPIVKDRLTFFAAGRTIPTAEDALTTANPSGELATSQSYVVRTDQDRWQIKLTGSVTPNHVFEASYLDFSQTTNNYDGLPPAHVQALGTREDPRETQTLEYNGILSDRLSLNIQATRKRVSILAGAPAGNVHSPFLDFYGSGFQIWNANWWDFGDPSDRDADTLGLAVTQSLSAGDWGDHTLEYGVQYVNSITAGENRQSATGFNLLNYDAFVGAGDFANVDTGVGDPNDPRFNLISLTDGGFTYRWVALPLGGDQELKNLAAYVQDAWEIGKWRIDAGLRWESYEGNGPQPTLDLDFDEVSPRLGVTYNLDQD